jgi:polysaccharide biosynthesis transport protein
MAPPIIQRFLVSCSQNKLIGLLIFGLIFGGSVVVALIQGQSQTEAPRINYKATGQLSFSNPPPTFTSTGQQLQDIGRTIDLNRIFQSERLQADVKKQLNINDLQFQQLIKDRLRITLPTQTEETTQQQAQIITLDYTESAVGVDSANLDQDKKLN